jgi:hypothetical protein
VPALVRLSQYVPLKCDLAFATVFSPGSEAHVRQTMSLLALAHQMNSCLK